MKIKIFGKEADFDQIAICVNNPDAWMEAIGGTWQHDTASSRTRIFEEDPIYSVIDLHYNYDQPREELDFKELELIRLVGGRNWHEETDTKFSPLALYAPEIYNKLRGVSFSGFFLSHLGIHSTEQEADHWRTLMMEYGLYVAQENWSYHHTNPVIAGKRTYHDVIFSSRNALGFDMKVTVRHTPEENIHANT
jgi:hypothetical protein